ncbi:hypothetical protein H2200_009301 [Cladophialophora chaetospira]|uniref:Heterokaryon incompatibility domain-containing protein n=1 Tax=Cladophialophora chaetospira TaxID=386627 RepID=A0AA39CFK8_9EURO|nr:hypothetical protein H2200_009301 [Cladophialophora chaetospira]
MLDGERKYDPSDPTICHSCRDFLPLDFTKVNPKPTLIQLRRTARAGCLKCRLLLGGIVKFSHFWEGPADEQPLQSTADRWEEAEIKIFLYAYEDDPLAVTVTRPKRGDGGFDHLELEFYVHRGEDPPFPQFHPAGDVPKTSRSEACFNTIKSWISECSSHHKLCTSSQEVNYMPSRFLDVGDNKVGQQILCLRSEVDKAARYAALSHSWGKTEARIKPVPKTQKANIKERMRSINWSELTQTFRDAVTITRRLNLRYLWIDALCIIQDDGDDWAVEASRMKSVYENAYIVIAATRSRTGDDGCFSERSCSRKVSVEDGTNAVSTVYVKEKISHRDFAESPATFETMPLFDRAWVFQERLLATRVVHYTKHEIMWECKEALRCECQGIESGKDWSHGTNTGNFKLDHGKVLLKDNSVLQRYKQWSRVLSEYSVRSLHFDGDRLPALSGIAGQMHLPGMGQYLAGIWSNSLPQSLTWQTGVGIVEKGWKKRRPDAYRAPSWSWASVEAECLMWVPYPADEVDYHCKVEEAVCTLVSPDPYGQVSGGHLVLFAPCFWGRLKYEKWKDNQEEPRYVVWFEGGSVQLNEDVPLNEGCDQVADGTNVLIVVVSSREIPSKLDRAKPMWKGHVPSRRWTGLALRPSRTLDTAFERIGQVSERMDQMGPRTTMSIKIV